MELEQLYKKYVNIQTFLGPKYRNYVCEEKFLDFEEFRNKIQLSEYITHKLHHAVTNTPLDVFLFTKNSKYIQSSAALARLLDRFRARQDVFLFTKNKLKTHIRKTIHKYDLNISMFLFMHFIMEVNKGPLCAKHTILTKEEARNVCFDLMIHGHKLPAIPIDDPQLIWINAEVNDVIKIEAYSEITGRAIRYRIVTPTIQDASTKAHLAQVTVPGADEQKNESEDDAPSEVAESSDGDDADESDGGDADGAAE